MKPSDELPAYLTELQLQWPLANYESLAEEAAREKAGRTRITCGA